MQDRQAGTHRPSVGSHPSTAQSLQAGGSHWSGTGRKAGSGEKGCFSLSSAGHLYSKHVLSENTQAAPQPLCTQQGPVVPSMWHAEVRPCTAGLQAVPSSGAQPRSSFRVFWAGPSASSVPLLITSRMQNLRHSELNKPWQKGSIAGFKGIKNAVFIAI